MPKDYNGTELRVGDYVTIDPRIPVPNMIATIEYFYKEWSIYETYARVSPALVNGIGTYGFKCSKIRKMTVEELVLMQLEN